MDMGKSSEAGTGGGESSATDFDVFLSFRGPDTRQGFTDCLYHRMLEANIRVFLDEEELHVGKKIGDELPTAIKKSKIYMPIFSRGYASSTWCLRELAQMVEECDKSKPSEEEIMPIFYDVEPRDVKLKSQLCISALDENEQKCGPEMRRKWEDALKSVAEIRGWELKEQGHWKFIDSVIQYIVRKLKTKDKYVTEHLVGMDDQVDAVLKLLDMDSGGKCFVLVHGMGGVGKTTLAKVVFNRLKSLFSHCCFLENVRESSLNSGLVTLQNQLLSTIVDSSLHNEINNVNDGIKEIAQRLSKKKLFIILDDVDDAEQLEKLALKKISFGWGSRVILTTRNRSIIEADQTLEYEVKLLDSVQSLELFHRHAFGRNPPPHDYVDLSEQVVSMTEGLPLAIEVIGSLLRRQNRASWMAVLDNLREIPPMMVQDKLKISYDALSYQQKQIFLDIACLFVDKDKANAFYMWKDCKFFPDCSIQVLVCMSLIKITADNKFWMHDQLRDLGRNIVRGYTTLMDPTRHSRLWVPETAYNIIRTEKRKEAIEAICFTIGWQRKEATEAICFCGIAPMTYGKKFEEKLFLDGIASRTYTSKEFSRLPNIRFLELRGQLKGDFENQLSELRYLFWHGLREEFLAINFCPKNLVVLQLTSDSISEDWAGWSQFEVAEKLKVLDLTNCCGIRRTPNFSLYTSLERLILDDCSDLIEVDGSLEKLKCLIYFSANYCRSLRELPEGIGGLEKLEYLDLGDCSKLRKLPESFARVASLVELDLSYTAITRLPDSIDNQKCLSVLRLQGTQIDELPSSIGNLQELKFLFLSHAKIRELPQSIVKLIKLEELNADHCWLLEWEIPEGIWKLSLLRVLHLERSPIRNVPETIQLLPRLEKLSLRNCYGLKVLPHLPTSLVSLSFGSSSLQRVSDLSNLTKLAKLEYVGADENYCPLFFQDGPCRQSLGFLPPFLSTLVLAYHGSETSLSFGCNLRNLTYLRMFDCGWKEIQLNGLEQLVELHMDLLFLEVFAGLSSLKRLKVLTLDKCQDLTAIQGLGSVESLEQLEITSCSKIESLDDLSDLKKLESLSIKQCDQLLTVKGLDELETLTRLELWLCRSLKSFSIPDKCLLDIGDCPNIEEDSFRETKKKKRRKDWFEGWS